MARDKNGCEFEEGQRVKVVSDSGTYEGDVIGLHEDGAHVSTDDGVRYTPAAKDCEVVPRAASAPKKSGKAKGGE